MYVNRPVVLLMLSCALYPAAETNDWKKGQESKFWKIEDRGGKIISHIWVPPNYDAKKSYSLAISLHGAGGRGPAKGEDPMQQWHQCGPEVTSWTSPSIQQAHPTIVFMPQCPEPRTTNPKYDDRTALPAERAKFQWVAAWWGGQDPSYTLAATPISEPMAEVRKVIDEILAKYTIDRSRIYVVGGSMGGFGTWDLVMRNPTLFAAAVPLAGGADPSQAAAILAGGTRIWTIHGRDDGIVPEASTVRMIKALRAAGATEEQAKISLLGTPDADDSPGHIWEGAEAYVPGITEWMFKQRRETTPGASTNKK